MQGATSHCLGQNFSKMFHIEFVDVDGEGMSAYVTVLLHIQYARLLCTA